MVLGILCIAPAAAQIPAKGLVLSMPKPQLDVGPGLSSFVDSTITALGLDRLRQIRDAQCARAGEAARIDPCAGAGEATRIDQCARAGEAARIDPCARAAEAARIDQCARADEVARIDPGILICPAPVAGMPVVRPSEVDPGILRGYPPAGRSNRDHR